MDEIKNIQMKKLFLFAIAGFFFATASNAQVRRDAPASQKVQSDTSHHFRKNMMADLNLTADQKAQLKSLHENMKQQREAIKNDATLTPDQKKDKMKELHKSQQEKMNSILTPDQQAKRKAFMEQRKQDHKMNGKWKGEKGNKPADSSDQQS
jgi:Spy/CpxP family protein refolding chaperone